MPDDPPLFDRIARLIADAHRDTGSAVVIDVKDRVSVPVGYAIGPRGGSRKIRSKPGEPPRKDKGNLQASIASETIEPTGDVIDSSVSASVPYARRLELDLHRPIFENEIEVVQGLIVEQVRSKLSELI